MGKLGTGGLLGRALAGSSQQASLSKASLSKHDEALKASKRKADDLAEGDEPAASEKADKRSKKRARSCARCGGSSSSTKWAEYTSVKGVEMPSDNACARCRRGWQDGFSYMSWEECCSAAKESKTFAASFDRACCVQEGRESKDWFVEDVAHTVVEGLKPFRYLIGVRRSDFYDQHGVYPEQVGIRCQNLLDETNQRYRGFLRLDPERPELYYMHFGGEEVSKRRWLMPVDRNIHSEQGTKTFDNQAKSILPAKLKKWFSDSEIMERVRAKKEEPEGVADEADEDGKGLADETLEVRNVVPAAPLLATPQVKRKKSPGNLGGDKSADGVSAYSAPLGRTCESVEQLIDRVDLTAMLSGQKLGRSLAPLEVWEEKIRPTRPAEADMLLAFINRARHAQALGDGNVLTMSATALQEHLRSVISPDIDFPTKLKADLIQRRFMDWQDSGGMDWGDLLAFTQPWPAKGATSDFDPLLPLHTALEGTPLSKGVWFVNKIVADLFAKYIKMAEKGVSRVRGFAMALQDNVDAALDTDDMDDKHEPALSETVVVAKALLYLSGTMHEERGGTYSDLKEIIDSAGKSSASGFACKKALYNSIEVTPWWSNKLDEARKKFHTERTHAPKLMDLKIRTDISDLKSLVQAVKELPALKGNLREGAADSFEHDIVQGISGLASQELESLRCDKQPDAHRRILWLEALDLMSCHYKPNAQFDSLGRQLRDASLTEERQQKLEDLKAACEAMTFPTDPGHVNWSAVCGAARLANGLDTDDHATNIKEVVCSTLSAALDFMALVIGEGKDMQPISDATAGMRALVPFCGDKTLEVGVSAVEVFDCFHKHFEKVKTFGDTPQDIVENDPDCKAVGGLISASERMQSVVTVGGVRDSLTKAIFAAQGRANVLVQAVGNIKLHLAKENLSKAGEALKVELFANNAAEGWSSSFSGGAFEDLLKHAKTTLLSKEPGKLPKAEVAVSGALKALKATEEIFNSRADAPVEDIQRLCSQASAAISESVLLEAHEMMQWQPLRLRRVVNMEKKCLAEKTGALEFVHPMIIAQFSLADR